MFRKHARPYDSCLTLLSDIMVCLRCTLYVSNSNAVSLGTCKITLANKALPLDEASLCCFSGNWRPAIFYCTQDTPLVTCPSLSATARCPTF